MTVYWDKSAAPSHLLRNAARAAPQGIRSPIFLTRHNSKWRRTTDPHNRLKVMSLIKVMMRKQTTLPVSFYVGSGESTRCINYRCRRRFGVTNAPANCSLPKSLILKVRLEGNNVPGCTLKEHIVSGAKLNTIINQWTVRPSLTMFHHARPATKGSTEKWDSQKTRGKFEERC